MAVTNIGGISSTEVTGIASVRRYIPVTATSSPGAVDPVAPMIQYDNQYYAKLWVTTYTISSTGTFDSSTYVQTLGHEHCVYLGEYSVSYGSKRLTLKEKVDTYGVSQFKHNDIIALDLNFGSGLQRVFSGRIKESTHSAQLSENMIEHSVWGLPDLANEVEAVDEYGRELNLYDATLIQTLTIGSTTISAPSGEMPTLQQAITSLFDKMEGKLSLYSIPSSYDLTNVPSGVYVDGTQGVSEGFYSAVQNLCSAAPGVQFIYDEAGYWRFVNVFESDVVAVSANSFCIDPHSYNRSSANRFTAVRLVAALAGSRYSWNLYHNIQPAWDESLEDSWSYQQQTSNSGDDEFAPTDTEISKVYREFICPIPPANLVQGKNVKLFYKSPRVTNPLDWFSVECQVALRQGNTGPLFTNMPYDIGGIPNAYAVVVTKYPTIIAGNPYVPGDAVGPVYGVALSYMAPQPYLLTQSARYPASGFMGTAYTEAGVRLEKTIVVPLGQATPANARFLLQQYMNVLYDGSVDVWGDPITYFLDLDARLALTCSTETTGLESAEAIVTEYSYNFESNMSAISFTTDVSGYIEQ
jgi:hypothetical protein